MNVNADLFRFLNQQVNKLRIKLLQRPLSPVDNVHLASCSCSDVGKFKRNVASAHQNQLIRKLIQFQKIIAVK
ncbi:hypothetical protein D3C76_1732070 [compost metagenome]